MTTTFGFSLQSGDTDDAVTTQEVPETYEGMPTESDWNSTRKGVQILARALSRVVEESKEGRVVRVALNGLIETGLMDFLDEGV